MSNRSNVVSPLPEQIMSSSYDIESAQQQQQQPPGQLTISTGMAVAELRAAPMPKTTSSTIAEKIKAQVVENILLISTIIAVLLGVGLGFLLREVTNLNKAEVAYFGFPGEMFLRALKLIILPLISSSLITGWTFFLFLL